MTSQARPAWIEVGGEKAEDRFGPRCRTAHGPGRSVERDSREINQTMECLALADLSLLPLLLRLVVVVYCRVWHVHIDGQVCRARGYVSDSTGDGGRDKKSGLVWPGDPGDEETPFHRLHLRGGGGGGEGEMRVTKEVRRQVVSEVAADKVFFLLSPGDGRRRAS